MSCGKLKYISIIHKERRGGETESESRVFQARELDWRDGETDCTEIYKTFFFNVVAEKGGLSSEDMERIKPGLCALPCLMIHNLYFLFELAKEEVLRSTLHWSSNVDVQAWHVRFFLLVHLGLIGSSH